MTCDPPFLLLYVGLPPLSFTPLEGDGPPPFPSREGNRETLWIHSTISLGGTLSDGGRQIIYPSPPSLSPFPSFSREGSSSPGPSPFFPFFAGRSERPSRYFLIFFLVRSSPDAERGRRSPPSLRHLDFRGHPYSGRFFLLSRREVLPSSARSRVKT